MSEALHSRPKMFRRYVDDSHARFDDADHAEDDKIQYTIEKENTEGVLVFLDISKHSQTGPRLSQIFAVFSQISIQQIPNFRKFHQTV